MGYACFAIDMTHRDVDLFCGDPVYTHWDGNTYTEPERKYNFSCLHEVFCLPKTWEIARFPNRSAIWIDYTWSELCVILQSESFPINEAGQMMPRIRPVYAFELDKITGYGKTVYSHLDMREVEADWAKTKRPSAYEREIIVHKQS